MPDRAVSSIGAAVIGSGFIGTVHIEALRRIGVQVLGLLGSSPDRAAQGAARIGVPRGYASLDELLADDRVEVVHVTSPNNMHFPQVRQILAAGRHVVCEKPLAMDSAESRELVRLARESGKVAAVNFNIRFYPLNQHLRASVADGSLGEVRLITGRYFQDWLMFDTDWNWRLEPEVGGKLRAIGDIGSHWLDLTSFVAGRRVTSVMADMATFIKFRHMPEGPVESFSLERVGEHGRARDQDRGCGHGPAPLRQRRAWADGRQPDQRRPQELAPVRDRRQCRGRGLGLASSPTRCGWAIAAGQMRRSPATLR